MIRNLRKQVRPAIVGFRARFHALFNGGVLAPGILSGDTSAIISDRYYFQKLLNKHGSIFKIWQKGKITTCIVGPDLGGKLIRDNRENLRGAVVDMSSLFPIGFIRAMEGETHKNYRRKLASAFNAVSVASLESETRYLIREHLEMLINDDCVINGSDLEKTAKQLSTALMLRYILGAQWGTETGRELTKTYNKYVPDGMTGKISREERRAFEQIWNLIEKQAEGLGSVNCLLSNIVNSGDIDPTILGNLLQMVELGRYDLQGLFRWLILEMASQVNYLERICNEEQPARRRELALSAVKETLRLHQIEYLARIAKQPILFQGYFIPKNSAIRICIWEAHRDLDNFKQPEVFKPDRFLDREFPLNIYAPVGLDNHRCLAARWTHDISAMLIEELALGYQVKLIEKGVPRMGKFHFEPGSEIKVRFLRKPEHK